MIAQSAKQFRPQSSPKNSSVCEQMFSEGSALSLFRQTRPNHDDRRESHQLTIHRGRSGHRHFMASSPWPKSKGRSGGRRNRNNDVRGHWPTCVLTNRGNPRGEYCKPKPQDGTIQGTRDSQCFSEHRMRIRNESRAIPLPAAAPLEPT